jgi:hypothetical protein
MHQDRAAPGKTAQGNPVALLVGQLELRRGLPQQRLAARDLAWPSKICANSTHNILR